MEKNYGFKQERARKYSKQITIQNNFDSGEGVGRERIALMNLLFVTLSAVSSIIYLPLGVVIILTSTIISSLIYINKKIIDEKYS